MRRILRNAAFLVAIAILPAFPWGPLFPVSPWHPGYEKKALERADVYAPLGVPLPADYLGLDRLIAEAETFHNVKFSHRLTVIRCTSWGDFERFVPWMRSRALGGLTYATGTVIYITPKLDEKKFSHGEFLRHELSHAAMHQNQGLLAAIEGPRAAPWLFEGMAVSYGRQTSYKTLDEVQRAAETEDFVAFLDPDKGAAHSDMRLAYPVWRYFNEYLKERDAAKYETYVSACMKRPADWRKEFAAVYGVEFTEAGRGFQQAFRRREWTPHP